MSRRLGAVVPLVASLLLTPVVGLVPPAAATQRPVGPDAVASADPDPADRESMRQGYLEVLKPALATPIGWTGDLASCDPGAPSAAAQQATLTAVNYFRDLVGVEPVTFSTTLSAQAQQAALMMARNGTLDHTPPSTWDCWTTEGADAAGRSNLALGNAGASAVLAYMEDGGSGNEVAGHRRWIIDPRQTTMGSGSVKGSTGWQSISNALYVLDSTSWQQTPATTPEYLPWPVAGYVPVQVEPGGRWSLSASDPGTDFSQATVTVDGSAAGITVHSVANGYGPPTLVWDFDPGFAPGDTDRTYHVVVSDIVVGGVSGDHAYDVTLFDAEASDADVDPPVVTRVGAKFAVRLGEFSTSWEATDASGVDGFQQRERTRTTSASYGAWSSPDGWDAALTTEWAPLPQGETLCLSARARDTVGNISDWTAPACVHTPVDDAAATATGRWRTVSDPAFWNGSARTTRKRDATLKVPSAVRVDRVGVVATRCAGCGKLAVYVGRSKVGVISLDGPSTQPQVVTVLPRLGAPVDGAVRLVVISARKKVQVDGVVVSGAPSD